MRRACDHAALGTPFGIPSGRATRRQMSSRPSNKILFLIEGLPMSHIVFLMLFLAAGTAWATEPPKESPLIARPGAFETLVHPNCSHCFVEAGRRKDALRSDDRVLCWVQVQTDGYINDGAIPLR